MRVCPTWRVCDHAGLPELVARVMFMDVLFVCVPGLGQRGHAKG